ncbi:hypothetical protein PSHT_00443, partial [Puccinia striiformis]
NDWQRSTWTMPSIALNNVQGLDHSTPTPPGSNDVEWSTGDISSTAPNGVQGLDPSGSMGTITRGIDFTKKNHAVLIRQLCKQLDRQHSECHLQTVDFNLLAVFIMQEFEDKLCIQRLVEMILNQFGDRTLSQNQPAQSEIPTETDPGNPSPKNTHQNQIHQAAISVSQTISHYNRHPLTTVPFCLQYPTYFDVLGYSIEQEKKYVFLPGNKMVVLVDEAGICVGVGVPPDKSNDKKSYLSHQCYHHMSTHTRLTSIQDRALCSLNKMVLECRWNTSKQEINYSQTLSPGPSKPRARLTCTAKETSATPNPKQTIPQLNPVQREKEKQQSHIKHTVTDLVQSTGMQDRKMKTNRHGIVASELQGHGDGWKNLPIPLLPNPLCSSVNASDGRQMVAIRHEMRFYSILSLWINKAFLPESTAVAKRSVKYLSNKGLEQLRENLTFERNRILACSVHSLSFYYFPAQLNVELILDIHHAARTISLNTQITTHRDKKKAFLFDSNLFFGNHRGGEFLLPSLGVAYRQIFLSRGTSRAPPPRRYSVAYWSRESSFSACGRVSAYRSGNKVFNDAQYWIPIYPKYDPSSVEKVYKIQKSESKVRPIKQKQPDDESLNMTVNGLVSKADPLGLAFDCSPLGAHPDGRRSFIIQTSFIIQRIRGMGNLSTLRIVLSLSASGKRRTWAALPDDHPPNDQLNNNNSDCLPKLLSPTQALETVDLTDFRTHSPLIALCSKLSSELPNAKLLLIHGAGDDGRELLVFKSSRQSLEELFVFTQGYYNLHFIWDPPNYIFSKLTPCQLGHAISCANQCFLRLPLRYLPPLRRPVSCRPGIQSLGPSIYNYHLKCASEHGVERVRLPENKPIHQEMESLISRSLTTTLKQETRLLETGLAYWFHHLLQQKHPRFNISDWHSASYLTRTFGCNLVTLESDTRQITTSRYILDPSDIQYYTHWFVRTGNNSSIYTLLPRSSSKSSSTSSPSRSFAHLQEYCLNQTHGTISLLSISLKLTPPTTQIQSRSSSTNSQSNNHNNSDHSSSRNYSSSNPIALFYLHQPIDIIESHIPLTPPFSTTSHHQSNIHHSNKRHHQQSRLSRTIYHPSGSPILQLSSINNTDENGGGHYKLLSNQKIDRLNLVIGIAYGFTSGTLSGICLLFAKTGHSVSIILLSNFQIFAISTGTFILFGGVWVVSIGTTTNSSNTYKTPKQLERPDSTSISNLSNGCIKRKNSTERCGGWVTCSKSTPDISKRGMKDERMI